MIFLGSSQTFLGVLISLFVLCMVLNDGNFLYNILVEIKSRIYKEIDDLDKELKFEDINDSSDYKLLIRHINEKETSVIPEDQLILSNAIGLKMKVISQFASLKSRYSGSLLKPASNTMDRIEESKEQLIAPLYALLSCIMIFICDELIVGLPQYNYWITSYMSIFILISTVYWSVLWITYYSDINISGKKSCLKEKIQLCHDTIGKKIKWKYTLCVPIIYIIFSFVALTINRVIFQQIVLFGLGLVLPIIVLSILKIRKHHEYQEYTYESCIKHFIGFSIMSIIITLTSLFLGKYIDGISLLFIYLEDFTLFKYMIFIFILFEGLILPFLVPYLGFHKVLRSFKSSVEENKAQYDTGVMDIEKELNKYCKENIPQ